MSSNISATSPVATTAATVSASKYVPGGAMGENSFLQLLATQLQNQDPLSPVSNSQFVAQLAQFSSLQQMTNVSSKESQVVSGIAQLQASSSLSEAFTLLGKTVSVTTSQGSVVSGSVTAVANDKGQAGIAVGGTYYPISSIISVK